MIQAGRASRKSLSALVSGRSELALRVCSALMLVPFAVAAAYVGSVPFALFWWVAAVVTLREWIFLVAASHRRAAMAIGAASLVFALAVGRHIGAAFAALALAAATVAALAPAGRRLWLAAGIPYSAAIAMSPIVLRRDPGYGFLAIMFLFAVVWGTDTAAYFIGRAIGGARLVPSVSPNKTWSGALAGVAAAVLAGVIVAHAGGIVGLPAIAALAALLSIVAQGGDLFESYLKRKFGAKDSGRLIPGHGGLMDRLDGFVAAGALAALIGVVRGGLETPGRGLLIW
jgi:phosphatidate cytidylyltransferase